MNACANCETPTSNAKYCSRSCAARANNAKYPKRTRAKIYSCERCGTEIKGTGTRFCSKNCMHYSMTEDAWNAWLDGDCGPYVNASGYLTNAGKQAIIRHRGTKCEVCGWCEEHPVTGKVPIELDHTDGDVLNNQLHNLVLLCPNHHALTPTYGSLNSARYREKHGLPNLGREHSRPQRMASWANG